METKILTLSGVKRETVVYCISDADISEKFIHDVIESNSDYFDHVRKGLIGAKFFKFEQLDKDIIIRTFSESGFEAASYTVMEDNSLYLYEGRVGNNGIYKKNGLRVVEYEEGNDGIMIYRMLDENDLYPFGKPHLVS